MGSSVHRADVWRSGSVQARVLAASIAVLQSGVVCVGQPSEPIASYFGFDAHRIIVVGNGCGPVTVADFNGDGRPDIAVVNNGKSRVEIHYLRASERSLEEASRAYRVNELPPNPWYDTVNISVSNRVGAIRAFDVDRDGRIDLVCGGSSPAELFVLRQNDKGEFEIGNRRRVRDLTSSQSALVIADVVGNADPEVIAVAGGRVQVFPLSAQGVIGNPIEMGSSGQIVAVFAEDFDGDGRMDLLAAAPDDASPLRLWLQTEDPRPAASARGSKQGLLPSELRFEMPPLTEVQPVRIPGRAGASIAVIERASRRVVLYDVTASDIAERSSDASAERSLQAAVGGFVDGASKGRSVAIADLNGDGRLDMLATDFRGNAIALHVQEGGVGITPGRRQPTLKNPKSIAVGSWDGAGAPEVFVLSEDEKTVGVSRFDAETGGIGFPSPITLATPGSTPLAIGYADLGSSGAPRPTLGVIVKDKRDHVLELHRPSGEPISLALKGVTRPPQTITAVDADRDGQMDLLLLTPGEPLMMVRNAGAERADEMQLLTKDEMKQFGLIQAAGPDNTALLDMNGDGSIELIIADQNFVRGCVYDAASGWRVVKQVNVPDSGAAATSLVGASILGSGAEASIVVSDRAGGRLLRLARSGETWEIADNIRVLGFPVGPIWAGAFGGDGRPGILAVAEDGYALVALQGSRPALEQVSVFRADSETRLEHDIEVGDVNGDGFTDLVVLDAREQMCMILSLTASRRIVPATEFKVFESRLFMRGDGRQYEPSASWVGDLTGDGAHDIMLTVHDRLLIYPQMRRR
ncbi:MAG: VCBS repeat-containing protein [Phycisphaeraceae bacterium]|nr:VCBS repeat-containing protein [Phycisphaeraceae bacterium]